MKKVAYYGGSFDPVHLGHLAVAEKLIGLFELDEFIFIPAFHAPHKPDTKPTSAIHRYAMLALATNRAANTRISTIEIDLPAKPYTVETLERLKAACPGDEIYFVMGADSWQEITTWRDWERVLLMTSHIVVTRPGFSIVFDHVTERVRERIVDLRGPRKPGIREGGASAGIFITDAVKMDISASQIRDRAFAGDGRWKNDVADEVAKYIEKYELYK